MNYIVENVEIGIKEGSRLVSFDIIINGERIDKLELWACVDEESQIDFEIDKEHFYFSGDDSQRLFKYFGRCSEVPGLKEKLKPYFC